MHNCSTCKFVKIADVDPNHIGAPRAMACEWGPPQIMLVPTSQGINVQSMHPPVSDKSCCHQYQPKTVDA